MGIVITGGTFYLLFSGRHQKAPSPEKPSPSSETSLSAERSEESLAYSELPGGIVVEDTALKELEDSLALQALPEVPQEEIERLIKVDVSDSELANLPVETGWLDLEGMWTRSEEGKAGEKGEVTVSLTREDSLNISRALWGKALDSLKSVIDSLSRLHRRAVDVSDSLNQVVSALKVRTKPKPLPEVDTLRELKIKKLAKMVEAMNPQSAAQVLGAYSPQELSEVLIRLKPRTAARILEAMPAARAGEVSRLMVGR